MQTHEVRRQKRKTEKDTTKPKVSGHHFWETSMSLQWLQQREVAGGDRTCRWVWWELEELEK
jgi:hypothetical protein